MAQSEIRNPKSGVRYALYLGCTVPVRGMNYETAARKVAERLGIELVDVEGFSCCGFPAKPLDWGAGLLMAARNLALAEAQGLDILALCSACTGTLTEANHRLKEDVELRTWANEQMAEMGRTGPGLYWIGGLCHPLSPAVISIIVVSLRPRLALASARSSRSQRLSLSDMLSGGVGQQIALSIV